MGQEAPGPLRETVLHDWHVASGARMVPFGGWDMPVQYKTGTIREHLATRRHAGLFDVSHMGRYLFEGAGAEAFLSRVLTNTPRALAPMQAQYTYIANERGGAVDDAYLYRLAAERFLLVVNAGNRERDWEWLTLHDSDGSAGMSDVSEALAMIALQGPASASILDHIVPPAEMPEHKRNAIATVHIEDHEVIVARTGYTGESVCFELFVPRDYAVALWQRLVDLDAIPAGLGARDSLRLEAGLPLYGHELGEDVEGNDIPIFANPVAPIAVRPANGEDYIGKAALERQRDEFVHIRRGEIDTPVGRRVLNRLVQPIAVFSSRRPIRAGFRVFHESREVGYVTSGTTVPGTRFHGAGHTAKPSEEHELRPIGLALIESDLRYRSDRPVLLTLRDDRDNVIEAELVETNLWPASPYARPHPGFRAPRPVTRIADDDYAGRAVRLNEEAAANTGWRRAECINLIPSEQPTSAFVDRLVTADPAGRYNEHSRLKSLGPDAPEVCYYKGTGFIMEKEQELKAALRGFFGCARVEVRPISGQMANDTVYDALLQFRNRRRRGRAPERLRRVLVHDLNKGGHLSAQPMGALKNYLALDPDSGRAAAETFPVCRDNAHRIDVDATKELIERARPELIVFGRSVIIHREPVAEIAAFVHELFGKDNPQRPLIMYDGAHVLGLLGPHYQQPLAEGADIVTGSTHKTFFGPQRGVILSDIPLGSAFEELWGFVEQRAFPGHVSNHHLGTLLGLLGATYEMLAFRDDYPAQVIANAKAFARALADTGLAIEGDPDCDFTETHQILLRVGRAHGEWAASLLEANNVVTNSQAFHDDGSFAAASGVRMGAQEMTRHGMKESDFAGLAGLVAEILAKGDDAREGFWRDTVKEFRAGFREMRYCL